MQVKMIAYSLHPEVIAGIAAKTCVSKDIPDNPGNSLEHALESGHESVLEHASFTFAVSGISRACSHQLVRHRLASYSQQSQRYVHIGMCDDYVIPQTVMDNEAALEEYGHVMETIVSAYDRMIEAGIPQEDARYILPNAWETNIVVTMNARELRHFLKLRLCSRAQWEIRELASKIYFLVKEVSELMFEDCGPACIADGRCPEKNSCGKSRLQIINRIAMEAEKIDTV